MTKDGSGIQEREHALARLDAEPVVGETRGGAKINAA